MRKLQLKKHIPSPADSISTVTSLLDSISKLLQLYLLWNGL